MIAKNKTRLTQPLDDDFEEITPPIARDVPPCRHNWQYVEYPHDDANKNEYYKRCTQCGRIYRGRRRVVWYRRRLDKPDRREYNEILG